MTYSTELRELTQANPHWVELINSGKFENEKAMLSLRHDSETIVNLNPVSVQDALNAKVPTLSTLKKYQGEEVTKAVINSCLIAVNEFFGEKSGLTDSQIEMVSEMLYEDYHYMNVAEIKLCVKNGIKGRYEKVYGKIAPNDLMGWFASYCNERMNEAAKKSVSDHGKRKKEENESKVTDEYALQQIKAIREALEGKWDVEEPNVKKWEIFYRTIPEYCRAEGLDLKETLHRFSDEWEAEYNERVKSNDVDLELFISMKEQQFLLEVNDKKNAE